MVRNSYGSGSQIDEKLSRLTSSHMRGHGHTPLALTDEQTGGRKLDGATVCQKDAATCLEIAEAANWAAWLLSYVARIGTDAA